MCFCKQVGVSTWEEAKEKLPEYATEKRINQFHILFKGAMRKNSYRVFLKKYCNMDDGEESAPPKKQRGPQLSPLQVIPMEFINFCSRAKKYRDALERGDTDPLGDEDTRFRNFKPEGAECAMKWQVYQEDVCHLQVHVPKMNYKLAIADVPYGFNFKGCRHEDKDPFSLQNFNDMINSFASVIESDYWTMVNFHSLQQASDASKSLSDFGCSVVPGVWIKTNCRMPAVHVFQPHTGIIAPAATYKVELPDGDVANKLPNANAETNQVGNHSVEVTIDPETLKPHATSLSQDPSQPETQEAGETSSDHEQDTDRPLLLHGAEEVAGTSVAAGNPGRSSDADALAIVPISVPDSLNP
ncbi:hypothetical protein R1sor_022691 [Riccia sorocarpa]|uniref:Uncharacterized protein n=1 Tax=Riccia sorocarpa TaxID=122646 RepID=A0ABD3GNW1_9MARC